MEPDQTLPDLRRPRDQGGQDLGADVKRRFLDQELTILAEFLGSRRGVARERSEQVRKGSPLSTPRVGSFLQRVLADLVPPQPDRGDPPGSGLDLLDQPFDQMVQPVTCRLEAVNWIFHDPADPGIEPDLEFILIMCELVVELLSER